jgi:hypothetical protein
MSSLRQRTPSPRRKITIAKKYEIIDAIENGLRPVDACKKFELPQSTIGTILKKKEEIKKAFHGNLKTTSERIVAPQYPQLEQRLFEWFLQARHQHVSISGPILLEKALVLAPKLGCRDFKASSGWLHRFKQRYNITFQKGEFQNQADDVKKIMLLINRISKHPIHPEGDQPPGGHHAGWE